MTEPAIFYVYLSKGRVLLIGDGLEDDEHSHNALQITIDLQAGRFTLRRGTAQSEVNGAVIKPNVPHHVVSSDAWRAVLLLDAQTVYAQRISQRFAAADGVGELADDDLAFCREQLVDFIGRALPIERADTAIGAVIDRLAGGIERPATLDARIERALARIHQMEGRTLALSDLAAHVHLSESRLSHLFKQEIGIPLQRYLLWYKVAQTAFSIGRGMSLTDAAIDAGFADNAHFSRTFRAMFGITPSQILKRSRFVQVISDRN
jgi:AraC-like DNA-binding protein